MHNNIDIINIDYDNVTDILTVCFVVNLFDLIDMVFWLITVILFILLLFYSIRVQLHR